MSIGKPFKPDKADIADTFSKLNGNITSIAKKYEVTRETIYEYLRKNPDIKIHLGKVREQNEQEDLDNAEKVMRYCMSLLKTSPKIALESAKYVLDKKGHLRNWGDAGQATFQQKIEGQLKELNAWTEQAHQEILRKLD